MDLPKGIRQVVWKKADGKSSVRFRVRIKTKAFECDKLFDSLKDAKDFLFTAKTTSGKSEIEAEMAFEKARQEAKTLSGLFDIYAQKYLLEKDGETPKGRNEASVYYSLKKALSVQVADTSFIEQFMSGAFVNLIEHRKQKLGDISIHDITLYTATSFIEARLQEPNISKATIYKQLSLLQGFWNKLKHLNYFEWKLLKDKQTNPFQQADKELLAGHDKRRTQRVSEEAQTAFLEELSEAKTRDGKVSDVRTIFLLCLLTGCRRNEILGLLRTEVFLANDDSTLSYIELPEERTKTEQRRSVFLNADAKALLSVLMSDEDRKDNESGRLFTYTVEGFNTVWQRAKTRVIKKNPHLKGMRFHDLRREFISSAFENLAVPSVALIQQFTSLKDTNYLAKTYLKAKPDLTTESGIMAQVGHSNKATHKRYISMK